MTHSAAPRTRLILASASPRRAQLLTQAGYSFRIVTPPLQEPDDMGPGVPPHARAEALSYFKARSVLKLGARGIILAADTVVAHGDRVFGKPDGPDHARDILRRLAGTTHQVITGLTLIDTQSDVRVITHDRTRVTMRPMTARQLDRYIAGGSWKGKAGAYGIQDHADPFVQRIEGSFTNVVGLPMERLTALLTPQGELQPNPVT